MAVLRKARAPAAEDSEANEDSQAAVGWKPPEGQQGDGRTKLNDLLGY